MKESLLFIGIGQGGSNIVNLFDKKGYLTFYLNTSNDDLSLIDSEFKYHVPGGRGCNKDRKKALQYAQNYYEEITNTIDSNFPTQDVVYLVFTLGGGTGSGLGPILLEILSMKNPDKKYNGIVVLPGLNESVKTRINAIESYKQLSMADGLNNLFVISNDYHSNKIKINKEFVDLFDEFMNITKADERGIIDKAELELLLTTKGTTIISKIKEKKVNNKPVGEDELNFNITFKKLMFPYDNKGCKYIGLSTTSDNANNEIKELEKTFGKPIDTFIGYNEKNTMAIISGMKMPINVINELSKSVEKDKSSIDITENTLDIEVPSLALGENKKQEKKDKNIQDLFKKYTR